MKWICTVCNYVHEGDEPPDICPVCKKPKEAFEKMADTSLDGAKDGKDSGADGKDKRKWLCTVCKYVHEGDSPPDICPVCKKPWSAFIPDVTGPDGPRLPQGSTAVKDKPATSANGKKADRWRCVICNYVHDGPEPPDVCPLCGAGRDAFVPETKSPEHHHRGIGGLIEKLHLHPVSAHFPNGALPLSVLSWIVYLILDIPCAERASFYLMLVAVAAVPVTAFSGWSDAKHRFGTTVTGVFPEKKMWSWVLLILSTLTAGWRLFLGWNHVPGGTMEMAVYTALLLAATAVAARLGMLGGKLVFGH